MATLKNILLTEVFPSLRTIKQENVVLGEPGHPRRLKKNIVQPEYSSGFSTMHETPEACFCVKGECVVALNKRCYLLKEHDLCLVNRNMHHYESFAEKKKNYAVIWFHFIQSRIIHMDYARYKNGDYRVTEYERVHISPEIIRHFDTITAGDLAWPALQGELKVLFRAIEYQLKHAAPDSEKKLRRSGQPSHYRQKRIEQAKQYIEDNYTDPLSLHEVARFVGLNPAYFAALFSQTAGMTFLQFLNSKRLRESVQLLNNTNLNIAEIAYQCGFADPYYFSRIFKKFNGISPREFRNRF